MEIGRGYDCELVNPPPAAVQTQCPICMQILREPCLVSCCGHKFCQVCIERTSKDGRACPLCNEANFTFMRERWLERSVNDLEVWCSYKRDGCEWKGKLQELELHLNKNPPRDNSRLNGCQFVKVKCLYMCEEWYQRHTIMEHEAQLCRKRPYSCEYCQDYHSIFEDVTECHHSQCPSYPVTCPNACQGFEIKRQELEVHLHNQCPLTLVDCPFNYAGCMARLPRKDMPEHVRETVPHLTLLATTIQQLQQSAKDKDEKYEELLLKQSATEEKFREEAHKLEGEVQALKEEVLRLKTQFSGFPIEFYVQQSRDDTYSPPFYTHPQGYRMCVQVYPDGNGKGKGTHVSIFGRMMQGPFDDYLKWPFQGEITVQLVNQAGDSDHIERTIHYTDRLPDDTAGRVIGREMSKRGWGVHKVISHTALHSAKMTIQYLKSNQLLIRITNVHVHFSNPM